MIAGFDQAAFDRDQAALKRTWGGAQKPVAEQATYKPPVVSKPATSRWTGGSSTSSTPRASSAGSSYNPIPGFDQAAYERDQQTLRDRNGPVSTGVTTAPGEDWSNRYKQDQRNELMEFARSRPMADGWQGEGLPMPEEGMYNKTQYLNWLKEERPDAWDAWQPYKGGYSHTFNPSTGIMDGHMYDQYGNRGPVMSDEIRAQVPGLSQQRSNDLAAEAGVQSFQARPQEAPPPAQYNVPRPAEWGQPQQAPQQSMAQQYGWGAGLGGQPQQQMPQWGGMMGGMGGMGGMPQWGGAPQQQAMPQWGQMMQQQPMGGPMAGMEAARMGGGAMQQMGGGGSPWASMWGNPFAGRQMTTDPNSPAMGGLPQMDPATQLLMQMQGMGGGFGAGGGSSGGGGMSGGGEGAYQTPPSGGKGVGQTGVTGGGDPYGSLASILALFAGGGGGGGGGGGASYNPMYGGLPRNGLYYADLMGAGG